MSVFLYIMGAMLCAQHLWETEMLTKKHSKKAGFFACATMTLFWPFVVFFIATLGLAVWGTQKK